MEYKTLVENINRLKKEKNAVILAHCYQKLEIDEVADFVGDSLYLSQIAAKTDADIIVFAGVSFMAETAKILSPDKKVLLPRLDAGCPMADMINLKELNEFKAMHKGAPVVCYVNSCAEVKANSDICCTSSNAIEVVKSLRAKTGSLETPLGQVLFVPDKGLGGYVNSQLDDIEVISYPGFCPTHMRILPDDIDKLLEKHPNALVLAHPECCMEVIKKADYVGSTAGIMNFAKQSDAKCFIIATEIGVVERLQRDYPEKEFILASDKAICPNMKRNELEDIFIALDKEINEVELDETLSKQAFGAIEKMLAL